MVDLRSSAAHLIAHPLVPVPPVEGVVARARRYRAARLRKQMGASVLLVSLALTVVVRAGVGGGGPDSLRTVDNPRPEEEEASAGVHFESFLPALLPPGDSPLLPWSGQNYDGDWDAVRSNGRSCPAHTNPGLPPVKIMANDLDRVSPTEAQPYAAVKNLVRLHNDFLGGICGRAIELVEGALCSPYTSQRLQDPELVAVVGMPFDPDLDTCIADGTVDDLGIPVVGGDGLTAAQHGSKHVYPVGTSAAALTRTAVEHARASGARNFTLVYDSSQTFAREAADSFVGYVARIRGTVKERIDLGSSVTGLVTESQRFERACGDGSCDFVFLALQDDMAQRWLQTRPAPPRLGTAALPTLLTGGFPETCFRTSNDRCRGLSAWTGFAPWFEQHVDTVEDTTADDPTEANLRAKGSAMVESALLGAWTLIDALKQAGPGVTRAMLRAELDQGGFRPYPTAPPFEWGPGLPRVGNPVAQPWRLVVDDVDRWSKNVGTWSGSVVAAWSDVVASWPPSMRAWADYVATEWPGAAQAWATDIPTTLPAEARQWHTDARKWLREDMKNWWQDTRRGWWSQARSSDPRGHSPRDENFESWLFATVGVWTNDGRALSSPLPPLLRLTMPDGPGTPDIDIGPPPGTDTALPRQRWEATGDGWRRDPGRD